jgi:hypothetical protein
VKKPTPPRQPAPRPSRRNRAEMERPGFSLGVRYRALPIFSIPCAPFASQAETEPIRQLLIGKLRAMIAKKVRLGFGGGV